MQSVYSQFRPWERTNQPYKQVALNNLSQTLLFFTIDLAVVALNVLKLSITAFHTPVNPMKNAIIIKKANDRFKV